MSENYESRLADSYRASVLSEQDKFDTFSRFTRRQVVANFLNRYEIFKKVVGIQGSVIEGGVNLGQGLFSWLHFSAILEPYNHNRRIIGFDSFQGFVSVSDEDSGGLYEDNERWESFRSKQSYDELTLSVIAQEMNRPLNHIPKLEVVAGDACQTIPEYFENNKHCLVALMHLDFDVYPPTQVALEVIVPRMPKGAVIAFDEVNDPNAPGETLALLEELALREIKLERLPFDSNLCFCVL